MLRAFVALSVVLPAASAFLSPRPAARLGPRPPRAAPRAASPTMAAAAAYCLNVNLYVKPERRDEFLTCIRNNAAGTLSSEPAAIEYTWGESATEPNTFHFHEKYVDEAGFQAHTQTPHFAAWETFASSDPFTKPPEVTFFSSVPASES